MKKSGWLTLIGGVVLMHLTVGAAESSGPLLRSYVGSHGATQSIRVFLPDHPGGRPHPALLWFHGGSWRGGGPQQLDTQSSALARAGFVVLSSSYGLLGAAAKDPGDCLADATLALLWVRTHAAELNLDPARLAVGGASAGGQLALCLCLDPACAAGGPPPCAFVGLNPVVATDTVRFSPVFGPLASKLNPTALAATRRLPPALLLHGERDVVVPPADVAAFAAAVKKGGGHLDEVTYPGVGHGFFNPARATPQLARAIETQLVNFLRRTTGQ